VASVRRSVLYIASFVCLALAYFLSDLRWFLTVVSVSICFAAVSCVITARRLMFMAAATPHAALFAAALGVMLSSYVGLLDPYLWALAIGTAIVLVTGFVVERGVDPDIATSVMVSATACGSVIAITWIATYLSMRYSPLSLIVGDPLLVDWNEVLLVVAISVAMFFVAIAVHRVSLCMGFDLDHVRLATSRVWLYDIAIYVSLAITSVAMVKVVGFVLQHVLILLPSAIGIAIGRSARDVLEVAVCISIAASSLGLAISILLDLPPSGMIGLAFLCIYIATAILRKLRT